jgi:hypothetical protein
VTKAPNNDPGKLVIDVGEAFEDTIMQCFLYSAPHSANRFEFTTQRYYKRTDNSKVERLAEEDPRGIFNDRFAP